MEKFIKFFDKIIIALIILICGFLCSIEVLNKFDFRIYDVLLSLKSDPKSRNNMVLIDIDDYSLEKLGAWPWSRDIYANTLIRLKELGAKSATFDVEYLSRSNPIVNPNLKSILESSFENHDSYNSSQEYSDLLQSRILIDNDDFFARSIQFFGNTWLTINSSYLAEYSKEDLDYVKNRFLFDVNDSKNLIFKGNLQTIYEQSDKSIFENVALKKIDFVNEESFSEFSEYYEKYSPALNFFISRAAGAGFTNSFIDSDGSRRRVELFCRKKDGYIAELAFAPLLDIIQPTEIIRNKKSLDLIGAKIPNNDDYSKIETKDIKIPLDDKGRMLVNWKHSSFADSFKHQSLCLINQLDVVEDNIYSILQQINGENFLGFNSLKLKEKIYELNSDYSNILEYKNYILSICDGFDEKGNAINGGISDDTFNEYFTLRKDYFNKLKNFVSNYENNELEELQNHLLNIIDVIGAENVSDIGNWFVEALDVLKSEVELYDSDFKKQVEIFDNSFCIIGNTASGTTDLGTTPFYRAYPNVGLHANVYNTIMTQEFITPIDWWWGVIITGILSILLLGFIPDKNIVLQIFAGVFLVLIVIAIPIVLMVVKGFYLPTITSILIAVLSFLSVSIFKIIIIAKEKKYITDAFSQCLAPSVVKQLIANPDSFKLGGDNIGMSAIFTDIQKFSSFSELLSAPQLVALLNYYLTQMCNIFMSEGGTIDKFEGDAIVAFVGAPYKMEDHAARICSAALKMKAAERLMNEEIKKIAALNEEEGLKAIDVIFNENNAVIKNKNASDMDKKRYLFEAFKIMVKNKKVLFTRIGINSGEMTAGYMGSDAKKNYTMMGNNVNLASRLEGVNKQYSTAGILISEHTRKDLGDRFIVRSLDRVRVVNVNTPLRLYELVAERSTADEQLLKYMDNWEKIMKLFEARDYAKSLEYFKKLSSNPPSLYPEDKVAAYYISLIEKYFIKGKIPTEKDDAGVAFEEDGVFKLLQK